MNIYLKKKKKLFITKIFVINNFPHWNLQIRALAKLACNVATNHKKTTHTPSFVSLF